MIFFDDKKAIVTEFKKIIKINEKKIICQYNKNVVNINGNNMYISVYEKDEFEIKGEIFSIEINSKS